MEDVDASRWGLILYMPVSKRSKCSLDVKPRLERSLKFGGILGVGASIKI